MRTPLRACTPSPLSIVPDGRHPAKGASIDGDAAKRGEWHVGRHNLLAGLRRIAQEVEANAHRLFGVMLESVMPVGMVESDREQRVAREEQPLAFGFHPHDAVARRVPA